ncbi:MAG: sigma-70 family RNA polymerase sigma factor [Planctomycetes bacterium]|nr:sigma-70 family RNA polymerase sigma factor [Planctomycetota bacterium]
MNHDALGDFDTQLMLQVRDGNREAANALVRRNFERVSRYVARVVRQPRAVEDLTQDVFVQVLTHANRYEPTAKFSTWLYRVATNMALHHLDRARVRRRVAEPVGPDLDIADTSDAAPDVRMSLDELRDRVALAIGTLPAKQRVALTLFEYEGLSYEQTAAVLEVTVEGVRSLLMRARTTLRRKLIGLL